jgi:hypothetical protein
MYEVTFNNGLTVDVRADKYAHQNGYSVFYRSYPKGMSFAHIASYNNDVVKSIKFKPDPVEPATTEQVRENWRKDSQFNTNSVIAKED